MGELYPGSLSMRQRLLWHNNPEEPVEHRLGFQKLNEASTWRGQSENGLAQNPKILQPEADRGKSLGKLPRSNTNPNGVS